MKAVFLTAVPYAADALALPVADSRARFHTTSRPSDFA